MVLCSRLVPLFLGTIAVAQPPNLLVNGGFELGVGNTIAAPSTAMTGWTVFVGSIDQVTMWQPSQGVRSVDLDGLSPGGIRQVVPTIAGRPYDVLFALCGNPDLPGPKSLRVSAAGQSQVFTFDSTGYSYQNMGWVQRSWSFTANGASATLEFLSLSTAPSSQGACLDDVRLSDGTLGYLSPFGNGCAGTTGMPALIPNQLPAVGQPFSVALINIPANTIGLLVLGNSHAGFSGGVLPLAPIGMPGCTLYANLDVLSLIPNTGPFGAYVWGEVLPSQPQIAGALFSMQFFFLDLPANAFGLSSTGGAIGRVGF